MNDSHPSATVNLAMELGKFDEKQPPPYLNAVSWGSTLVIISLIRPLGIFIQGFSSDFQHSFTQWVFRDLICSSLLFLSNSSSGKWSKPLISFKSYSSTRLATVHLDTPSNLAIFVQLNPSVLSYSNISTGVSKDGRLGFTLLFFFIVTKDAPRVVGVTAMEEM